MKKILIIEDEEVIRENLVELLELECFEAISAPNGLVGIECAQMHHPDLIFCDMMMPGADGYQVIQTLKQLPETATIPFVFLTAKAHKDDVEEGLNLGADAYLTKPYSAADLLAVIACLLKL